MYRLSKRVISQFIRTGCRRRLRLDLYRGVRDRRAADAPEKDAARPGLALLTEQGKEYERAKFRELEEVFPNQVLHGDPIGPEDGDDRAFAPIELAAVIDELVPNQLVLEAQFEVTDSFRVAHRLTDLEDGTAVACGQPLRFDALRPDIIQVQAPTGSGRRLVTPRGRLEHVDAGDQRRGLRIVDIKISGEPSPAHFSELAYYGMALAGWLAETSRQDRFIVLADAAIWPGAHDGSTIRDLLIEDRAAGIPVLDTERYLRGLESDLEVMPAEVVLGRIQRFLRVDLREVLAEADWRQLHWHLDSRCYGCDYLGYRWSRHDDAVGNGRPLEERDPDVRYCWPMAEQTQHLSRVAGLTEGACGKLREADVPNVGAVAELPGGAAAFERHQTLRAKRTVLSARALTLRNGTPASIPHRAGTSAVLPRFADIRVSVSADFDVGSGLTFAFGYRIDYGVPDQPWRDGPNGRRYGRTFNTIERPILVLERALRTEGETLRIWLQHLVQDVHRIAAQVVTGYRDQGNNERRDATVQFFLWDRLTYNHLCRVFGRHLDVIQGPVRVGQDDISPIAWVFPAESVLEDPGFVTRSSPVTIVADAINSLVAAPIPHHYGVIDLANSLEPESRTLRNGEQWSFRVNRFYRDPLSDQIPSERGHEIWNRTSPFRDQDFQWHQEQVRNVVRRKLGAVAYVTEKITRLLRDELTSWAPRVNDVFQSAKRLTGVGDDGQILYQHCRLMAAAQRLEIDLLMAMPPHEREARFFSARVEGMLQGREREGALDVLGLQHRVEETEVLVFRLSERSREARLKEGEFTWSFLPEADLAAVQDSTVAQFKNRHDNLEAALPIAPWEWRQNCRDALTATILKVNRGRRLLAVEAGQLLHAAIECNVLQLDLNGNEGRFGIFDPISIDVFTRKLQKTLEERSGIRHPRIADERRLFPSLGVAHVRRGRPRVQADGNAAAEYIWNADVLSRSDTGIEAEPLVAIARRSTPGLTARQQEAIATGVARRLALWWGPPGTGKTRTAQAFVGALACHAVACGRTLRVAITGLTWVAIDNVGRGLPGLLQAEGIAGRVHIDRLNRDDNRRGVDPTLAEYVTPMDDETHGRRRALERRLAEGDGVTIVAGTVDQLYKLGEPARCAALFDVLLIDEASQLDVAHAVVAFSKLAEAARVVVVGDDRQMAPIHPLEAPEGLEHLLGSIYGFYRGYRRHEGAEFGIGVVMLNRNFRSNREIVGFVREAGYGPDLEAAEENAGLRMRTANPVVTARPENWPEQLAFTTELATILSADEPLVAVVHDDRFSSQRNDGEAELVAGLVFALFGAGLIEQGAGDGRRYGDDDFFRRGVGIVTPHRAQQAAVYDRLDGVLPEGIDRDAIFSSIDTVERFQGQERIVMLASFGLGDADQIAAEEQFMFSLNRFNVAASRAQAKFIALISRQLVDYLPRDRRALEESRLLKHFVTGFLTRSKRVELPILGTCDLRRA